MLHTKGDWLCTKYVFAAVHGLETGAVVCSASNSSTHQLIDSLTRAPSHAYECHCSVVNLRHVCGDCIIPAVFCYGIAYPATIACCHLSLLISYQVQAYKPPCSFHRTSLQQCCGVVPALFRCCCLPARQPTLNVAAAVCCLPLMRYA